MRRKRKGCWTGSHLIKARRVVIAIAIANKMKVMKAVAFVVMVTEPRRYVSIVIWIMYMIPCHSVAAPFSTLY